MVLSFTPVGGKDNNNRFVSYRTPAIVKQISVDTKLVVCPCVPGYPPGPPITCDNNISIGVVAPALLLIALLTFHNGQQNLNFSGANFQFLPVFANLLGTASIKSASGVGSLDRNSQIPIRVLDSFVVHSSKSALQPQSSRRPGYPGTRARPSIRVPGYCV
eukprot:2607823-Rhodomonas_salina.1